MVEGRDVNATSLSKKAVQAITKYNSDVALNGAETTGFDVP